MDRPPGKLPNTSSRLIAMAVGLVGDAESVRLSLRASPDDFAQYVLGEKEPSLDEFDRLVQLIVTEQHKIIARNRELIARIREKQKRT